MMRTCCCCSFHSHFSAGEVQIVEDVRVGRARKKKEKPHLHCSSTDARWRAADAGADHLNRTAAEQAYRRRHHLKQYKV